MSAGFALPGPSASLIQAAYAFRVTWSERVCERLLSEKACRDAVHGLGKQ